MSLMRRPSKEGPTGISSHTEAIPPQPTGQNDARGFSRDAFNQPIRCETSPPASVSPIVRWQNLTTPSVGFDLVAGSWVGLNLGPGFDGCTFQHDLNPFLSGIGQPADPAAVTVNQYSGTVADLALSPPRDNGDFGSGLTADAGPPAVFTFSAREIGSIPPNGLPSQQLLHASGSGQSQILALPYVKEHLATASACLFGEFPWELSFCNDSQSLPSTEGTENHSVLLNSAALAAQGFGPASMALPTPARTDDDYLNPAPGAGRKRKRTPVAAEGHESKRPPACIRCRTYKKKCNPGPRCDECLKVEGNAKLFDQPCERGSLLEVKPFRSGNSRLGEVETKLPRFKWCYDELSDRTISISPMFAVGHFAARPIPELRIRCKKFVPGPCHVLEETYEAPAGDTCIVRFPAFACVDAETPAMERAMARYLDDLQEFADKAMGSETDDEIIKLTMAECNRVIGTKQQQTCALASALKIRSAAYISEIQPVIRGPETLGIPPFRDSKYPQAGHVLIPISMDYQLDNLYIAYMRRLLKRVHSGLNKLLFKGYRDKNWYETFLTSFVLLTTLERVYESQIKFVRKYAGDNPNFLSSTNDAMRYMLNEWQHSAKMLIYHWRVIARGPFPFSLSQTWTEARLREANFDNGAAAYLKAISSILGQRHDELKMLSQMDMDNESGRPLLWVSRLFFNN